MLSRTTSIHECACSSACTFHVHVHVHTHQVLLQLTQGLFEDTTSMELMMRKIMLESQELIPCEQCTVLLIDPCSTGVRLRQLAASVNHYAGAYALSCMFCSSPSPLISASSALEFFYSFVPFIHLTLSSREILRTSNSARFFRWSMQKSSRAARLASGVLVDKFV